MLVLLVVCGGMLALLYGVAALNRRSDRKAATSDFQVPPGREDRLPPPGTRSDAASSLRARFGQRVARGPEEFEVIRPGLLGAPLARLLFRERPSFSPAALQEALLKFRRDAVLEPVQNETLPALFSGIRCKLGDRSLPAQVFVSPEPFPIGTVERAELAPESTACDPYFLKHVKQLDALAESCAWELHVYTNAGPISARLSLDLLVGVAAALAELTRPEVIYWQPAKKWIAPADLGRAAGTDDLLPLVTTLRRMALPSPGEEVTILVDTIGLADFCIPDVEMRFDASLDPRLAGLAATAVFAVAMEVWGKEVSIADGDRLRLPAESLPSVVARYAEPTHPAQEHRVVLALDPGEAYSAPRRAGSPLS